MEENRYANNLPAEGKEDNANFSIHDLIQMGMRLGMPGRKNRAAVLVGEDGRVIGADFPGNLHDLLLVHPDDRTQDRQVHHSPGNVHRVHGLAGDLPQALAGDQGFCPAAGGYFLGNAHHEPAHDNGE